MRPLVPRHLAFLTLAAGALTAAGAPAQELEPRAYSPNPVGANFVVVTGINSSGDVVFDPTLPIKDTHANVNAVSLAYNRTFGLLGRSASVALAVPYVWGTMEGQVAEEFGSIRRSGLGDGRLRFAVNLVGGPALPPREFAQRRPTRALGFSLWVTAPTGQYDPTKLINLGANRWAFRPELGLSFPVGRWAIEGYTGVWLFAANSDYFGGSVLTQNPIATLQAHLSYNFKPRLWLAGDGTFYMGGRRSTNGVASGERQSNSRVGLTLAVPMGRRNSVKASWAYGLTTSLGAKFNSFGLAWQYFWF